MGAVVLPGPQPDPRLDTRATVLAAEAEYLHQALFGYSVPERLALQYIAAHDHVLTEVPEVELAVVQQIVALRLDAQALELVLRRRSPANPLSQKFHILCYLLEIDSAYYQDFHNEERSVLMAYCRLTWETVATAYRMAKGWYLLRRYHLA